MAIRAAELPEQPALPAVPVARPALRLVPQPPTAHLHQWRLVSVEYDDFGQVRMFECAECPEVRYD